MNSSNKLKSEELNIYSAISDFIGDINECLTTNNIKIQSIINYAEIVKQTTLSNKQTIRKHISTFKEFIDNNEIYIKYGKPSKLVLVNNNHIIKFSDNIFIDMSELLKSCNMQNKKIVHDHIKNIARKIYPSMKELQIAEFHETGKMPLNSNMMPAMFQALNNPDIMQMVNTMAEQVDTNETDPMKIAMSVMASPALPNMISQINKLANDGKLDTILDSFRN